MAKYTEADIARFRARAHNLNFDTSPTYYTRPTPEMMEICNGIGGAGGFLNPVLNFVYMNYQASSSDHDERYHVGGDFADRLTADKALRNNMILEWKDTYGWLGRLLRPKARQERQLIDAAYLAVRAAGHNYFNYATDKDRAMDTPQEAKK